MDAAAKFKIVERIVSSEDEILLNEINLLLGLSDRDFWDDLSESTKKSIQKGKEQAQRNQVKSHEDVMSDFKKRFIK
jgi:hypothetical protein